MFSSPLMTHSDSAVTLVAAFDLAGLFKMSSVTKFFECAFFVQFLFQTAESALDGFTFFQAYFCAFHCFHPLPFLLLFSFFYP